MTIANLQIAHDLILDPMLEEMLEQLGRDKPNWFFHPVKERHGAVEKSRRSVRGGLTAPEDKYFISKVRVVQDGRVAGTVWVEEEYRYRSDNRHNYVVFSNRIENGRRGNTMKSTKMDVAIRNAKKHFDPPKTGELLYEAMDNARDSFVRVISGLHSPLRHHMLSGTNSAIRMQLFIRDVLDGKTPDKGTESFLREELFNDKYKDALSKELLAVQMERRKYQLISIIEGDYCMFAENFDVSDKEEAAKATVWGGPFEQLPDGIQNKLAVLQLMEDHELVLDVGFRHHANAFLIVMD